MGKIEASAGSMEKDYAVGKELRVNNLRTLPNIIFTF